MHKNVTIKKFTHLPKKPNPVKKGITYSIEHAHVLEHNNPKGHIYKKYINGNLVKQIYLTYSQSKSFFKKIKSKISKNKQGNKGGTNKKYRRRQPKYQPQPQNIQVVQAQPRILDNVKTGFGYGIGFEAADILAEGIADMF